MERVMNLSGAFRATDMLYGHRPINPKMRIVGSGFADRLEREENKIMGRIEVSDGFEKDREFDPKEEPELLLHPGAYIRYRNGKEVTLNELTIKEIREGMELPFTDFYVEGMN